MRGSLAALPLDYHAIAFRAFIEACSPHMTEMRPGISRMGAYLLATNTGLFTSRYVPSGVFRSHTRCNRCAHIRGQPAISGGNTDDFTYRI
jgi:hypothetical protein